MLFTVNAQYLPNGKGYKVQTWYTDGARRPASATSAVRGQGYQADIMLRPEVRHIFGMERPTNFKLVVQMKDEDPYRHDGPSPARSKVKIAMSRGGLTDVGP